MKLFRIVVFPAAFASGVACAQLAPLVLNQGKITNAGGGTFAASPNYVGSASDSSAVVIQGSSSSPSTTQGPAIVVSKTANSAAFNAFAGIAFKKSSGPFSRATAIYGEATDLVGGNSSFVEAARLQANFRSSTNKA